MIIYEADDPLVLNGTYDREGYKPGERARIVKAKERQEDMAKKKPITRQRIPKKTKKAKGRNPRAQALPGLEQVRNIKLDRLCESIGDGREVINKQRTEEKADLRNALREMHDRNVTVYRHAGVELVRIPGEEKLRVRTSKEDATDITPETPSDVVADEAREIAEDPPF
jgi:hypothetical protein